jgi:hypothetical protein
VAGHPASHIFTAYLKCTAMLSNLSLWLAKRKLALSKRRLCRKLYKVAIETERLSREL